MHGTHLHRNLILLKALSYVLFQLILPQTNSTGHLTGTALDGSTPKKSTEQNTQYMKNGGGGI